MREKKILAALLAAVIVGTAGAPAFALNAKATGSEAKTAAASVSGGAFTGSTPVVQYLYKQFSSNPSSLSVPVSIFSAQSTDARFEELGLAAIEAYIQNGLTDYVEDFQYQYTDGDEQITMNIIYANKNDQTRRAQGQQLDQAADQVVASLVKAGMSEREKAQVLSNYVAQNVKYDFAGFKSYQAGQDVNKLQTAYAALVGKNAICQGFARAYKLLCDKAGIPCVVLFGRTKQFNTAHAWNRVYLDGKWETVDTSNPQLVINRIGSFCIPADTVARTLEPDASKTLVPDQAAKYLQ